MMKATHTTIIRLALGLLFLPLIALAQAETGKLRPMESGMASRIGGVPSYTLTFGPPPASLRKAPTDMSDPFYTIVSLGPKDQLTEILVLLDDPPKGTPRLFVDANANGDLTDDPPLEWKQRSYKGGKGKDYLQYEAGATVSVRYGSETLPRRIGIFRYDKADPDRVRFNGALHVYPDYGYEGELTLGGQTYKVLLADVGAMGDFRGSGVERPSGVSLYIDVNSNGMFDWRGERYDIALPFNIKGTTYVFQGVNAAGSEFQIAKSPRSVPEITPPPDLRVGKKVPAFEAKTLDGRKVAFPADYKGKRVILYFWASWCPSCREELPNLAAAYEKFHPQGIEVLGISLDDENQAAPLTKFLADNKMPWPEVYDGKRWKAAIAQLYFPSSIPSGYLVDGDTGEVLASGQDLLGERLAPTLQHVLEKKK